MFMTFQESKLVLDNLDFISIKKRLCLPPQHGGFGWDLADAEFAIQEYLKFLESVLIHIDTQSLNKPVFSSESRRLFEEVIVEENRNMVAIVWEAHILNTRQYIEDCQRIFKHFLHYSPGLVRADETPI